jgi:membrane protease YdiL (CAAX protease family)
MKAEGSSAPDFCETLWLLLGASWKRAAGRRKRQQELLHNRAGKEGFGWGGLGFCLGIFIMALLNLVAGFAVYEAVISGERLDAERSGKMVVSGWFINSMYGWKTHAYGHPTGDEEASRLFKSEASNIARDFGGNEAAVETKIRNVAQRYGSRGFIVSPGFKALPPRSSMSSMLGSLMLMWWGMMLIFQGEGLDLDLQRRRHPMWEWLFSHPAPPGAIFLAEMVSPIAANPIYYGAPLFTGILYGCVYGAGGGILAAPIVGIPIMVAAACLGKALEIGVTLRFSPRSRGAMIGLMSWLGYASLMLIMVGAFVIPKIATAIGTIFEPMSSLPWPWLGLFLGQQPNGSFSMFQGVLTCWMAVGITIAGAIWFSIWGAQRGLSGNFGGEATIASVSNKRGVHFGKDPLYRKEFLWFIRDRGAIVQTILIPLTIASFQAFNLRGLLSYAQNGWNSLCGVAILFGTYFLWILGPKSLSSEGAALWISLTWPQGLESLLKAKAWLWSLISSGIVALVLCYAAIEFPASIWKIGLVGIGWYFFGRSMAEKTVTLVTVTSSSGEPEKIPAGRRWAASLGMLTFAIGICTQQWHIAIMGIVYSYITAAAMWQNFRARLPYLYDPWSEELPPPPTLMHAMIGISILVEGGAVLTGMAMAAVGRENIAVVQVVIYGFTAIVVSIVLSNFLTNRGVPPASVWCREDGATGTQSKPWWGLDGISFPSSLLVGAAGGCLLGMFGRGYLAVLRHIPFTAEMIHRSQEQMAGFPGLRLAYVVMAVGLAPFAEEYLFRGLLFRALDREWGGWPAVIGSAAFFAIYHPPLSWLPVGLLGIANALLFKHTGRLAPAVLLHMVYNAVVLS